MALDVDDQLRNLSPSWKFTRCRRTRGQFKKKLQGGRYPARFLPLDHRLSDVLVVRHIEQAGYDGYKGKRGGKLHMAANTLGQPFGCARGPGKRAGPG